MLELQGVSKSFDEKSTWAVRDVSFGVREKEFVCLIGESGSGKTTTLKMLNRLVEPSAGTIRVLGENVTALDPVLLRRSIGYVFQGIGLFPHFTIEQNLSVVPKLLGWATDRIEKRIEELFELIRLPRDEFRARFPNQLSGGQQQRVGVARALAAKPALMLMDEPFGALDPKTRHELQVEYKRLHKNLGLTTVMVTHDLSEAFILADRIVVMQHGTICFAGTPRELTESSAPYVQELMQIPREQFEQMRRVIAEPGSDRS